MRRIASAALAASLLFGTLAATTPASAQYWAPPPLAWGPPPPPAYGYGYGDWQRHRYWEWRRHQE